jgi:very-short-patch-repair endonuclease
MLKRTNSYMGYDTSLTRLARSLRKNSTPSEKILWGILRNRQFEGCKFIRQKPLLDYIADFYCAELLLILEIDGSSHDNKYEMDACRTRELNECGYIVIRYTNDEVLHSLPRVKSHLAKVIQRIKNTSQKRVQVLP